MRKIIRTLALSMAMVLTFSVCDASTARDPNTVKTIRPELSITRNIVTFDSAKKFEENHSIKVLKSQIAKAKLRNKPKPVVVKGQYLSKSDINLIALVTMAEAEGECELGKRLVIDTILNRVDSTYFPNTVHGVIYQQNQFTSVWTSRITRCYVKEDIVKLVQSELIHRTNRDTIFFTAGHYSIYGRPMFRVQAHYFSSYK